MSSADKRKGGIAAALSNNGAARPFSNRINRSSGLMQWPRQRAAAALRIEKNQPRILICNDARFMDLLQRFRPTTYWAAIARPIEKMAKARN